jgi:ATP-binding protein involved in chromosome partitioning
MADLRASVMDALKTVNDPEIHRDLVSLNMVKGVSVSRGAVTVDVELTTPACPLKEQIQGDVTAAVKKIPGVTGVTVNFTATVRAAPRPTTALRGVKHVIAVGSGKGGVGKSTVAANLALALASCGAKVGVLDLDVYGPSIPLIMGVAGARPGISASGRATPVPRLGVSVLSFGFFTQPHEATIVRAPILHGIVRQFLNDIEWGELDYLVVDLPPGTGDIPLSLAQAIPLTGAVVVTTPQDVALAVAVKAISMFRQLHVPILGLIENMSRFVCPHCQHPTDIFGHGGAKEAASKMNIHFLGEIPLDADIRAAENEGTPIVRAKPAGAQANAFMEAARATAGRVTVQAITDENMDRIMAKAATLFRLPA